MEFAKLDLDFEFIMEQMELKYIAAVKAWQWKGARNVPDAKQPRGYFTQPDAATLQATMTGANVTE